MLIHFGSALTGAEEESVLVLVREHREAATAGGLAPTEQGKGLARGCSPSSLASPQWPGPLSLRVELGTSLSSGLGSGQQALGKEGCA